MRDLIAAAEDRQGEITSANEVLAAGLSSDERHAAPPGDVQEGASGGTSRWDGGSWVDEFILVLWSSPMILAFLPGVQSYVKTGFDILKDSVPDWYALGWGAIVAAAYGFHKSANLIGMHLQTRHLKGDYGK